MTDELPYAEIRGFLSSHRRDEAQVFRDARLLRRALVRGPRDGAGAVLGGPRGRVTPPSTVFAAYNEYAGPKEIRVWPFSGHDAPEADHVIERLEFAARHLR